MNGPEVEQGVFLVELSRLDSRRFDHWRWRRRRAHVGRLQADERRERLQRRADLAHLLQCFAEVACNRGHVIRRRHVHAHRPRLVALGRKLRLGRGLLLGRRRGRRRLELRVFPLASIGVPVRLHRWRRGRQTRSAHRARMLGVRWRRLRRRQGRRVTGLALLLRRLARGLLGGVLGLGLRLTPRHRQLTVDDVAHGAVGQLHPHRLSGHRCRERGLLVERRRRWCGSWWRRRLHLGCRYHQLAIDHVAYAPVGHAHTGRLV